MLYKVWVGNFDDYVQKLLKARFIHEFDENSTKDALHMYSNNEPGMKKNEVVLNDLPDELYKHKIRTS